VRSVADIWVNIHLSFIGREHNNSRVKGKAMFIKGSPKSGAKEE